MHRDDEGYSIQQAADITGLSKQVIRKWEERYQIVQPQRLDNGYRMYKERDIKILLKVKALVDAGHSIKQASLHAGNSELSVGIPVRQEWSNIYRYEVLNEYVLDLLREGTHCNEMGMHLILQQAYHNKGLDFLLQSVVIPFLREVGNRWEKGEWGEYQETIASLGVKDCLVQIRKNFKYRDNAPFILGACLPQERHDIPVLITLLQATLKGWKTLMIGASPAPGTIEAVVQKLAPDKVILSASTVLPFECDLELLGRLDRFAGEFGKGRFYLGGAGAVQISSNIALQSILVIHSIDEVLEQE